MQLEYYYIINPLLETINESGDLIFIKETDNELYFGIIDALGHGAEAYEVAKLALEYLKQNCTTDPASDIMQVHLLLQQTRGAVIGLCTLNKKNCELKTCGVGNITTRVLGSDSKKIFYRDGIAGYSLPSMTNQIIQIYTGDIILLYSDGVKENFDLIEVPDITRKSSEDISKILMNNYSKKNDDASILTVKVKYD